MPSVGTGGMGVHRRTLRNQVLGMVILAGILPIAIYTFFLIRYFDAKSILRLFIMTIVPTVLLLLGTMRYLNQQVVTPLAQLVRTLRQAAAGDLGQKVEIEANNELSEVAAFLDELLGNLRDMIKQMESVSQETSKAATAVRNASDESAAAAKEIALTVGEIARGSEEQSVAAEQSLGSMQDVLARAQTIAAESERSLAASRRMAASSEEMRNVLGGLIVNMKQMVDENLDTAEAARQLAAQAQDIEGIVTAVSDIAEQTNLLALNASIEAARAGEHGSGFAVVAEEVRLLSEQSADSAEQIARLAWQIRQSVRDVAEQLEQAAARSEKDRVQADRAQQALAEVAEAVARIVAEGEAVMQMAQEVSARATEATDATQRVAAVSQQTAAGAEETAASTQEQAAAMEIVSNEARRLQNLAQELHEYLARYARDIEVSERLHEQAEQARQLLESLVTQPVVVGLQREELSKLLRQVELEYGIFELVFAASLHGDLVAASRPTEDLSAADRSWFRCARGETILSDPYTSALTNSPCITIALPIKSPAGDVIGVLGGDVSVA